MAVSFVLGPIAMDSSALAATVWRFNASQNRELSGRGTQSRIVQNAQKAMRKKEERTMKRIDELQDGGNRAKLDYSGGLCQYEYFY